MKADIEMAQDTITQLSTSLDRYEKRSDKRSGWAGRIDKTQVELKEGRAQLSILRAKGSKKEAPWRDYTVAAMQAFALFIILTAQLAAVTSLRSRNGSTVTKTVTPKRSITRKVVTVEQQPERYEETVKAVAEDITRQVKKIGSQAKLCKNLGLRPADVSMILNHEKKKEDGTGTISYSVLQKISSRLGEI